MLRSLGSFLLAHKSIRLLPSLVVVIHLSPSLAAISGTAYLDPNCPAPNDDVTVSAMANTGVPMLRTQPLSVTWDGSTARVVASGSYFDWGPNPLTEVRASLGKLAEGQYRVEYYVQNVDYPENPAVLLTTQSFRVSANTQACPSKLILLSGGLQSTQGNALLHPVDLRVVDSSGAGVPGTTVQGSSSYSHVLPEDECCASSVATVRGLTDAAGRFTAALYVGYGSQFGFASAAVTVRSSATVLEASYAVVVRPQFLQDLPPVTPVVEYFHPVLGHYFITTNAEEMRLLDGGRFGTWERTYLGFAAKQEVAIGAGDLPVCRFYGTPGSGPNSHFFTADPAECEAVKADPGWTYEGIAFHAALPQAGVCPLLTQPVYRAYNNGFARNDSNHRYSTKLSALQAMAALGWTVEGLVMCTPV
jgi:hypothetical protein